MIIKTFVGVKYSKFIFKKRKKTQVSPVFFKKTTVNLFSKSTEGLLLF